MRLGVLGSQNLLKYWFILLVNGIQKSIENLSINNLEHSVMRQRQLRSTMGK